MPQEKTEYTLDDTVPKTSEYKCTSCGWVQEFEEGDDFVLCDGCENPEATWIENIEEPE